MCAKPVSVDFSNTEDSGGFYIAPGTYPVRCTKAEDGMGDAGPYIKFSFNVEGEGVTLNRRCTLKADALFGLKNTLGALMGKDIPKTVIKFNPDNLVGRVCMATVADREYNGKIYSGVVRMSPYMAPVVLSDTGTPTDALDDLPF